MTEPLQPDTPLSLMQRIEGRVARGLRSVRGAWLLRLIGEPPLVIDGLTLDAHVQFILASRRRKPHGLMCGPTPAEARRRNRNEIRAVTAGAGVRPTRVRSVRDLTVDGADGPLAARHYAPLAAGADAPPPLLVFFHGGGFVICDLDTHDEPCRMLCHHGNMHVLSVAYRLAPEHPFPAGLDDCIAALRWAIAHAGELGADPSRICVGGDSAGANLAVGAALAMASEDRRIAAQLLIYPTTDSASTHASRKLFAEGFVLTSADMNAFEALYLNDDLGLRSNPRVSPARSPSLAQCPPTLVITAGFDPLRDEGEEFAEDLTDAGVSAQCKRESRLVHGFLHMTTVVPEAYAAVVRMARQFRKML